MHIERHHKEELEKESGEGGKVDAKDAVKMLAQKQKDLLEVKLAEKSKQQSDKAKGIDSSSETTNVKDRSAKKIVVDSFFQKFNFNNVQIFFTSVLTTLLFAFSITQINQSQEFIYFQF